VAELARKSGRQVGDVGAAELDHYWEEAKREE
jgi:hypothetical protein